METEVQTPVTIQYARPELIPSFEQCIDAVAKEQIYIEMAESPGLEKVRDYQMEIIKNNWPGYYAVTDGKVVGWVDISGYHNPRFRHRAHLGMGILPGYREKGLGYRLMMTALQHAKQIGLEKVDLEVYTSNTRAKRLYEKCGFQTVGTRIRHRKLGDRYFDVITMELFL